MKFLTLFSVIACSLSPLSGPAIAPEPETCCTWTKATGSPRDHTCGVKAGKPGKLCGKGSGQKEKKKDTQ